MTRSALSRNAWGLDSPHTDSEDWRKRAECRKADPELMYPVTDAGIDIARAICAPCPVKAACLARAKELGDFYGIWGGLTGDERRKAARPKQVTCASCPREFVPVGAQRYCPWCVSARDAAVVRRTCPACRKPGVPELSDGTLRRHKQPGSRNLCRQTTPATVPTGAAS